MERTDKGGGGVGMELDGSSIHTNLKRNYAAYDLCTKVNFCLEVLFIYLFVYLFPGKQYIQRIGNKK